MLNKCEIREFRNSDLEAISHIYNYYVRNGFAAYAENELEADIFKGIIMAAISCYVLEIDREVGGYAILRNYLPYVNFKHTGKLTYFIKNSQL